MGAKSSRSKGGTRKHGRDRDKCARYRTRDTKEKNKRRRIEKEERRQERFKARKVKNGSENGYSEGSKKNNCKSEN